METKNLKALKNMIIYLILYCDEEGQTPIFQLKKYFESMLSLTNENTDEKFY